VLGVTSFVVVMAQFALLNHRLGVYDFHSSSVVIYETTAHTHKWSVSGACSLNLIPNLAVTEIHQLQMDFLMKYVVVNEC